MKKIFYILSILITTVLLGIGVSVSYTYLLKKEKSLGTNLSNMKL